ncbi:hypothetical protein HMPREF1544_04780 [Mucor circinelloides 1006PhL]|uniref:Uncharacterized protein n=1 Tax=Mucor circinelloides f. circinelloides (strain 1006PhL) TaxID=1220926 RepID=S2JEZ9_MUCC1|nr:hypothetical protein HMPREF1544_04780 [Mucor circinelloides 1006PhL]
MIAPIIARLDIKLSLLLTSEETNVSHENILRYLSELATLKLWLQAASTANCVIMSPLFASSLRSWKF